MDLELGGKVAVITGRLASGWQRRGCSRKRIPTWSWCRTMLTRPSGWRMTLLTKQAVDSDRIMSAFRKLLRHPGG
jgi:hypothetical protein